LAEKQKLKNWYGLSERQFKKYVRESLRAKDATASLLSRLESRLDNIVFRLGLVSSRKLARQLVNHGFFLVNNKSSWAPSRALKKGDQIKLKPEKTKKKILASFLVNLKRQKLPAWLKFDEAHFEAEVVETPTIAASDLPAEASAIFEFYSR
jgi:small subunit ribosomal protein S4